MNRESQSRRARLQLDGILGNDVGEDDHVKAGVGTIADDGSMELGILRMTDGGGEEREERTMVEEGGGRREA